MRLGPFGGLLEVWLVRKRAFRMMAPFFGLLLAGAPVAADEEVGLAAGQQAPAFSLEDQSGETQSLNALLADGPVTIVFFRSADW